MSELSFKPFPVGVQTAWTLKDYPDCSIYVHVPDCYSPDRPIGLLFFLHGGDTDTPATAPFDTYLKPDGGYLRPFIDHIPFITVAPSAPYTGDPRRWNHLGVCEYFDAVVRDVSCRFNVDLDRVVLFGHSMGGFGAYHMGLLLADRLAGVGISAGAWKQADFRGFLGTPVYLMHGKYDCAAAYKESHVTPRHQDWCGISFTRAADELLKRDGIEHVYDEHDGGHGLSWEPTKMALRRFLGWAEHQRRQPAARRCAVITPGGSRDPDLQEHRHSRYLTLDETVPGGVIRLDKIVLTGPNIAWTIDEFMAQGYRLTTDAVEGASLVAENLGDNRFRLEATHVARFTIHFNSQMIDLERPVTLAVGGASLTLAASEASELPDYERKLTVSL